MTSIVIVLNSFDKVIKSKISTKIIFVFSILLHALNHMFLLTTEAYIANELQFQYFIANYL